MIEVEVEAEAWTAVADVEAVVRDAAERALQPPSPGAGRDRPRSGRGGAGSDYASSADTWRSNLPRPGAARLSLPAREGEDVAILLADDEAVRALNRVHRGQDEPTNVLSFPAAPSAAPHLGDVALAYETCAREAAEQGKTLADHLKHLVAHGVLHLLGWDHQTEAEAEAMEARERDLLADLGTPDPYRDRDIPPHG